MIKKSLKKNLIPLHDQSIGEIMNTRDILIHKKAMYAMPVANIKFNAQKRKKKKKKKKEKEKEKKSTKLDKADHYLHVYSI
jgi:ribosomal protein L12E/L44/L45/RPP1/RPP2